MCRRQTLRLALRLLREETDWRLVACFAFTLLLGAVSSTFAALSPLALKHLVDALDPAAERASLLVSATIYLLLMCGGRIAADVRPLFGSVIDQRLQAVLRYRFFDQLMRLPLAYLAQRRSGALIHSLDLATAGFQSVVNHISNSLAPAFIEITAMVLILTSLGQPLLVALFAATGLVYVATFALGALRLAAHASAVSEASLAVYAQLNESVGNVETLRCFNAEPQARISLENANRTLKSSWMRFNQMSVCSALAVSAVFTLSLASCLFITTAAIASGQMTVGGVVLASVYMLQMVRPLEVLGSAARDLARALSFMAPLLGMLAEPPEKDALAPRQPIPAPPRESGAPSVRFEDVHFGYHSRQPVIQGLNLEIQAGCTTAIVGRSGSGKSSLARLLMRLHSPQRGALLLDGQPVEEIPRERLRALIGFVPQDAALLHGSIASNIALGMPGATHAEIAAAGRSAQLQDLIDTLPLGYDTLVGERGLQLSGGERQRVAIARALLRQPRIYVLDEPTSMLDSKTEADIQQSLRKLTTGCTTLLIAHRLSTVMHADEIVVLGDGHVQERGRHADLLAHGGLYAQLWRQQVEGSS